mmetsp:Transcript_17047/g.34825  ORF Transcript_17047/g.34825 Transcript_17047/m.34825 type:complete len:262 (+) Transcript_17047:504-1289(+)
MPLGAASTRATRVPAKAPRRPGCRPHPRPAGRRRLGQAPLALRRHSAERSPGRRQPRRARRTTAWPSIATSGAQASGAAGRERSGGGVAATLSGVAKVPTARPLTVRLAPSQPAPVRAAAPTPAPTLRGRAAPRSAPAPTRRRPVVPTCATLPGTDSGTSLRRAQWHTGPCSGSARAAWPVHWGTQGATCQRLRDLLRRSTIARQGTQTLSWAGRGRRRLGVANTRTGDAHQTWLGAGSAWLMSNLQELRAGQCEQASAGP